MDDEQYQAEVMDAIGYLKQHGSDVAVDAARGNKQAAKIMSAYLLFQAKHESGALGILTAAIDDYKATKASAA